MRLNYGNDIEDYYIFLLSELEPRIEYYSNTYKVRGMDVDDLAQELRLHLWKVTKKNKYLPTKAKIQSWGNVVIRRKIWNLTDPRKYKRDKLDCDGRVHIPI